MPAYSGTPGSASKSVKGPGRARKTPSRGGSGGAPPALPVVSHHAIASTEAGKAAAGRYRPSGSGTYVAPAAVYSHGKAVGTSAGTVYHGPSAKQLHAQARRQRVAKQRGQVVKQARGGLRKSAAKSAAIKAVTPHITPGAAHLLKQTTPKVAIAVAHKIAPHATMKALAKAPGQPAAPKRLGQLQGAKALQAFAQQAPKGQKQAKPTKKRPTVPPGSPTSGLGASQSQSDVAAKEATLLLRKGYSPTAAAAIVGNSFGESSWNLGTTNPSSGAAGLFGFLSGDKSNAALQSYAAAKGKSPDTIKTQINFMRSTLEQDPAMVNRLNKKESLSAATTDFLNNWEIAPGQGVAARQSGAAASLQQIQKYGRQTAAAPAKTKFTAKGGTIKVEPPSTGDVTISGKGAYVFPFKQGAYSRSRTDQGVDFTGTGSIRAMGDGKIEDISGMGWPNGGAGPDGQNVAYTLTSGPKKGRSIFVAEGITPASNLGKTVKKGQVIGKFYPGSSIETGWYDPSTNNALAAPIYTEGKVTKQGLNFLSFLTNGKLGTASGGGGVGAAATGAASAVSTGATAATGAAAPTAAATSGGSKAAILQAAGAKPGTPAARRALARARPVSKAEKQRRALLSSVITELGKTKVVAPAAAARTTTPASSKLRQRKITVGL